MRRNEAAAACVMCGDTPAYARLGVSLEPFCWRCKVSTSGEFEVVIVCPVQGVARLDAGRAAGACVCDECGREYYKHPPDADHPYLTVLCDGSVVKL